MRYLSAFNVRLRLIREKHRMTPEDVAALVGVDSGLVHKWEALSEQVRCYPNVDQLIELCLKTGESLRAFLDLEHLDSDPGDQLSLPGFDEAGDDLLRAVGTLMERVESSLPDARERKILEAFRRCDGDRQALVLGMLGVSGD
ncbi:helix-turn-helix transcriptional regulator [Hahella sp. SMD15-11]|uniref:Helix-turn-helix transcriptional regulator n=1 Tax=Thermohahella caldifontis TaxID=3142973 RepID=A0AB39UYE8_9GAMM